tara:strand:- start:1030 stop:1323 length:294 start_codon:yes stop_codon:yes gene_type:complete
LRFFPKKYLSFRDAFSLFRENKRYEYKFFFANTQHCQIANQPPLLRVFFFFVVKEESSSSYKKREKKKNDERREENAPAVFQIQARAGDQLRVDEEW